MLPLFCLRLALGLLAAILVLPAATIHPRFYRTHYLTVLALTGLALLFLLTSTSASPPLALYFALTLACGGAILWNVEGAPGGKLLLLLTLAALAMSLRLDSGSWRSELQAPKQLGLWWVADDLTAAVLMGFALTAMLLGHSYLINPSMTLVPLRRLILGLGMAVLARAILAGISLGLWTSGVARLSLTDVAILWLPLRWLLGLIVPGVLVYMAWRTTLLRNTQSSTGILYVVVVFVSIGELTAQLLLGVTGYFL